MRTCPTSPLARLASGVSVLAAVLLAAPAAGAHDLTGSGVGYDVSYPQCGGAYPESPAFGIVGVNGGRVFKENPCLASQLAWAQESADGEPAFYANTGNPGPDLSTHWPLGQTSPRYCSPDAPNSRACSFDYGWNAATDSFDNAVQAYRQVNDLSTSEAERRAADAKWWLDVEILNSWQTLADAYGPTSTAKRNDTYALVGAVRTLWDSGVAFVGIYSTRYQWNAITGGRSYTHDWFSANPVWLAGFTDEASARAGCSSSGFTGANVVMTQYLSNGFDANYLCP